VAVADEANFTRAAARVHVSQSGVSAQIRQLEFELRATLIDRSTRRAGLTPAGAAALIHARSALAAIEALRQAVAEVNGLLRGRLTIGMLVGCTLTPFFDALAWFHETYPGVDLTLLEGASDRLTARVAGGDIDLALVGTAGPLAGVESLVLVAEPLVAAVPPEHALTSRQTIELADLAGHPIIALPPGTGVRAVLDDACAAAGIRPQIALQASAPAAVAELAARGLGIAILSESMSDRYRDRLQAISLKGVRLDAVLSLVWRNNHNPAVSELVRSAQKAFVAGPIN
jgi:DNA-binding transcriptional LysR family regulator